MKIKTKLIKFYYPEFLNSGFFVQNMTIIAIANFGNIKKRDL